MLYGFVAIAMGVGAVLALVVGAFVSARRERKRDAQADAQYRAWLAHLRASGGCLPEVAAPVRLRRGEACFFFEPCATLCELRAVRTGGYGGAGIRVAKGLTIHTGRFGSEAHDEWREVAHGLLYVTNERIVFDGDTKNRIVKLADLMSVHPASRNAVVNSQKLQKPFAFSSINGRIFATVVNSLVGGDDE